MPPSQYDNVMASLARTREEIHDLNKALRDHASLEAEDREHLEDRLNKALYGGNGDGEGIYERLRQMFGWKRDHESTHGNLNLERRSSEQDMRRFVLDVAKQTLAVTVAVLAILVVFAVTGRVVAFP